MSIITLTTDYGLRDHFVGSLKGKIYSEFPQVRLVDLSHDIDPFNVSEAAYIIESAYSSFPKGSVHLIGVDIDPGPDALHLAMEWNGHFFVCADNGILSLLTQRIVPDRIVAINIHDRLPDESSDLDVFVTVACHLAKGGQLNVIGKEIKGIREVTELRPVIASDNASIKGYVIYIDHFGNVVTNITKRLFQEIGKGRPFEIVLREKGIPGGRRIREIRNRYSDVVTSPDQFFDGERMAVFNTAGNLEIALYRSNPAKTGSASSLLGLGYRDAVTVNFGV